MASTLLLVLVEGEGNAASVSFSAMEESFSPDIGIFKIIPGRAVFELQG